MKTHTVAWAVVLMASLTVVVGDEKRIAGQWTMSAEGYTMAMALVQDGTRVAGTLQSPHGVVPIKGRFEKGWFELSGASDGKPHALELFTKGILRADGTLAGVMTTNVGDFVWTAVRVGSGSENPR
jgi:hypothetical protein